MYWLSRRTHNDLFLLYCFADSASPTAELRALVERRSARISELRVRLRAVPGDLDYPSWVPCEFVAEQFLEHALSEANWPGVLDGLGKLLGTGVDATVRPWRVHIFRGVRGVPGQLPDAAPALVVVLQMSHALADGRGAARIARTLFAESDMTRPPDNGSALRPSAATSLSAITDSVSGLLRTPIQVVRTVVRGYGAYRAQQQLAELTSTGRLPAPGPGCMPSAVNRPLLAGRADHAARMIVCDARQLRGTGRTVTVVVLTAISQALARYLESRGEPVDRLAAQVPMAITGTSSGVRNNYRNLGVDLFIDEPDLTVRADKIAAALAAGRVRAEHPLLAARDLVTAVIAAPLLRRDVDRYPIDTVPDSIAGHTVVSSVDRGPADLTFGGGRVLFTAGFPAIGAVMNLTHGVHGLGDTVTISVHADRAAVPDPDAYVELVREALRAVTAVPRGDASVRDRQSR